MPNVTELSQRNQYTIVAAAPGYEVLRAQFDSDGSKPFIDETTPVVAWKVFHDDRDPEAVGLTNLYTDEECDFFAVAQVDGWVRGGGQLYADTRIWLDAIARQRVARHA